MAETGLDLCQGVLEECGSGRTGLDQSATGELLSFFTRYELTFKDAYTTSLARHHGWVVRGVFHLAVKAAPYYNDFIEALLDGSSDEDTIATLMSSMTSYTNALERILDILDEFYRENQLESSKLI